jgi:hypothetical protein
LYLAALSPFHWLSDVLELRRLQRRLPRVHRAWSKASGKLRPESDAEYLARLRVLVREREQLRNRQRAATRSVQASTPIDRIADSLRDAIGAAEELTPATAETAVIEGTIDQTRLLLAMLTQRQRPSDNWRRPIGREGEGGVGTCQASVAAPINTFGLDNGGAHRTPGGDTSAMTWSKTRSS